MAWDADSLANGFGRIAATRKLDRRGHEEKLKFTRAPDIYKRESDAAYAESAFASCLDLNVRTATPQKLIEHIKALDPKVMGSGMHDRAFFVSEFERHKAYWRAYAEAEIARRAAPADPDKQEP